MSITTSSPLDWKLQSAQNRVKNPPFSTTGKTPNIKFSGSGGSFFIINHMLNQSRRRHAPLGPPPKFSLLTNAIATILMILGIAGGAFGVGRAVEISKQPISGSLNAISQSTDKAYNTGFSFHGEPPVDVAAYRQAFCDNLKFYSEKAMEYQGKQDLTSFIQSLKLSGEDLAKCQGILDEMAAKGIHLDGNYKNKNVYLTGQGEENYTPEALYIRFIDEILKPRLEQDPKYAGQVDALVTMLKEEGQKFKDSSAKHHQEMTSALILATAGISTFMLAGTVLIVQVD